MSNRYKTLEDYEVLLEKAIEEKPLLYHGMFEPFKGGETKIRLECLICNFCWYKATFKRIINGGMCPLCANKCKKCTQVKDLKRFELGENHSISRNKLGDIIWHCLVCEKDDFADEDKGRFKTSLSNLHGGFIPCRCSKTPRWDEGKVIKRILNRIATENLPYKFLHFISSDDKLSKRKFEYLCELHGNQSMTVNNFLNVKNCCPMCAARVKKYFYICEILETSHVKFGISSNYDMRIKRLNSANRLAVEPLYIFEFKDQNTAVTIETLCKQQFAKDILITEDFLDGRYETCPINFIDKILSIIYNHNHTLIYKRGN